MAVGQGSHHIHVQRQTRKRTQTHANAHKHIHVQTHTHVYMHVPTYLVVEGCNGQCFLEALNGLIRATQLQVTLGKHTHRHTHMQMDMEHTYRRDMERARNYEYTTVLP